MLLRDMEKEFEATAGGILTMTSAATTATPATARAAATEAGF
jgi:hypothetical protein